MLWSAFLLGLAGSLHCIGMCGPIALMIPTGNGEKIKTSLFLYHFGKLITYIIIGAIFGLIVAFIYNFNIQSILTVFSGIVILLFAFIPKILTKIEHKGYKIFNGILKFKSRLAKSLNKNKVEYSFYIGFLNGFIPCGMVYSAAIIALSQKTFMNSVVYMVFFGLGTIPLMILFYYTANKVRSKLSKYTTQIRMWSFIIIGVFLIWRGLNSYGEEIPKNYEGGNNFKVCLPF